MEQRSRLLLVIAVLASFGATGCKGGGGGGFLGFLGGDISSTIASVFGAGGGSAGSGDGIGDLGLLAGSFGDLDPGGNGTGDNNGNTTTFTDSIATVQSPEPASFGLFGGALFGLGLWRRRKASPRRV